MNRRPARKGTDRAKGPKPTPRRQHSGVEDTSCVIEQHDNDKIFAAPSGSVEYLKRHLKAIGLTGSSMSKSGLFSSGTKPTLVWSERLTRHSEPIFTDESERFLLECGVLVYRPDAGRVYLSELALSALPGSVLEDRPSDANAGRLGEWARAMAELIMQACVDVRI